MGRVTKHFKKFGVLVAAGFALVALAGDGQQYPLYENEPYYSIPTFQTYEIKAWNDDVDITNNCQVGTAVFLPSMQSQEYYDFKWNRPYCIQITTPPPPPPPPPSGTPIATPLPVVTTNDNCAYIVGPSGQTYPLSEGTDPGFVGRCGAYFCSGYGYVDNCGYTSTAGDNIPCGCTCPDSGDNCGSGNEEHGIANAS